MFDSDFWFKKKNKKFLHNIDSLYFSVFLEDDFTIRTERLRIKDPVRRLRTVIDRYEKNVDCSCPFSEFDSGYVINFLKLGSHAHFYTFHLECPDRFDVYIAPSVPKNEKGGCVTNQIHVQIRAEYLWEVGPKLAFDYAMSYINLFCFHFKLTIREVAENRFDYCFHTNALSNPEKFFSSDSLLDKIVTTLGRNKEGELRYQPMYYFDQKTNEKEFAYLPFGKRSDKCFLRIYHKTKEVVQEGYKGFFFYIWFFNGMISRYDLYCLEEAYKVRRWKYIDVARLQFAKEYMHDDLDSFTLSSINSLLSAKDDKYDFATIKKLADSLLPPVTRVYNVEYQVMRRMSKTFEIYSFRDNTGPVKRIYDMLDNHEMIVKYLTNDVFRIVDYNPDKDQNRSRASYCDFWKRLRGTKLVDAPSCHNLKLTRKYSSELDLQIRKTRAVRAISSVALAVMQDVETTIFEDAVELLSMLNDNDVREIKNYKLNRAKQMPKKETPPPDPERFRSFVIVDDGTGEVY